MTKYINSQFCLLLMVFVLALALFPTTCFALSVPTSPCDVGNGFFLFQPSSSDEGWHIIFEDGTQRTICYHVDREDGFDTSHRPYHDFDKSWIYIQVDIYEPKYNPDTPESVRTNRSAYFLFSKETREMIGPLTPNEFYGHPATADKNFDWKHSDYRDTRGVERFLLLCFIIFCFVLACPLILFGILSKWVYEISFPKRKNNQQPETK